MKEIIEMFREDPVEFIAESAKMLSVFGFMIGAWILLALLV